MLNSMREFLIESINYAEKMMREPNECIQYEVLILLGELSVASA